MNNNGIIRQVNDAIKKLPKTYPNLSINRLRVIVALERAIVRLESNSKLAEHLIFKGGFVLFKVLMNPRFTRDIDAIALGLRKSELPSLIETSLKKDIHDGLWFGDIQLEDLTDQGIYGGFRFNFAFQIGDAPENKEKIKKLSRIHLDVGFGDVIEPFPQRQSAISILPEGQPLSWLIYPLEFIYAEKLEALVDRGSASSRVKDVYDMSVIFEKIKDRKKLLSAIQRTFENRKTTVPEFFNKFAEDLDTSIMRGAWASIQGSSSFEGA